MLTTICPRTFAALVAACAASRARLVSRRRRATWGPLAARAAARRYPFASRCQQCATAFDACGRCACQVGTYA